LRHAEASRIVVRLRGENGRVVLEVEDDGVGFDPGAPELRSRRLGLTSMEERAQRLGAQLRIDSGRGRGTTVRLETAHD
jgi:signal transduction histidine kinase